MPDPITTLGLAKSASDIVKQALDFARESKNTDLAEKLIDAYRDIVELAETNQELKNEVQHLRDEVTDLKRRPEIAAQLRHDGMVNGYFRKLDGDQEEGPFCLVCGDADGKLIHLTNTFPGWLCGYCAKRRAGR